MIHKILIPKTDTISFSVPENYIGKEVEVIAFSKEEGEQQNSFKENLGAIKTLHVENKDYKFNRDEANER